MSLPQAEAAVRAICDAALQLLRQDLAAAAKLAEQALRDARRCRTAEPLAEAWRVKAHVEYLSGRYRRADQAYQEAIRNARAAGDEVALGRTLSSGLQTLVYLGRYEEARRWAEEARGIFERQGDKLRLARLESNLANVLHRQDRAEEALPLYESAYAELRRLGDEDNAAITLRNLAVCAMGVHDFRRSLSAYAEARTHYEQRGARALLAEVTDNLAYLHYLRGDYRQALKLYQEAREQAAERANPFYQGVAELDQSDLYLDLNQFPAAAGMATSAYERFVALGTRYEAGKALVNRAAARAAMGETAAALKDLAEARRLFLRERNMQWGGAVEVRRGAVLAGAGDWKNASRAAARGERQLQSGTVGSYAVLAALLQARASLAQGRPREALAHVRRGRRNSRAVANRLLETRLWETEGTILEALASPGRALRAYRKAHQGIRSARHRLPHDHLKLAYLGDKLAVYEALTELTIQRGGPRAVPEAFAFVEEAKSRGLADQLAFRAAEPLRAAGGAQYLEADRIAALRAELAWQWHQLDGAEAKGEQLPKARQARVRKRIAELEGELAGAIATLRRVDPELADLRGYGETPVEELQAGLPAGTALFEYYVARRRLYLFVLTRESVRVVGLGESGEAISAARLARFHLGRVRLPAAAPSPALESYLSRLYDLLLRPAEAWLPECHLVVVPHGELHGLPFHAFRGPGGALLDRIPVSYSLSAAVHHRVTQRPARREGASLVMGAPDALAPFIEAEARRVASVLPNAECYLGPNASWTLLQERARDCRYVHIATHGMFREDNPMFSSLRLGDGRMSVADLYELEMPAELVTLSGCFTGLGAAVGGGEFVGLSRGFLHAGARRLQVSLWAVADESAAAYMGWFYEELSKGADPLKAWERAVRLFREERPHPAYWANFILME